MYVRVRQLGSADTQTFHINCRSINETIDELREKVAQKWMCDTIALVRLFFDGKELDNGYTLYEYNIKLNNVIHVLVRLQDLQLNYDTKKVDNTDDTGVTNQTESNLSDEENHNNYDISLESDDYYRVGEHVDALDSDTGAWFEATISKILSNSSTLEHRYCVNFYRQSLGTNIYLKLSYIRPQASVIISFDELRAGQRVLANFNADSPEERGYWYECRVEKKLTKPKRKLFSTIYVSDIVLKHQLIRYVNEIYQIESTVRIIERSPELENLIQCGTKTKRNTAPDCADCMDNQMTTCKKCSCNRCGLKTEPEKQIICDECNAIYHIWCLKKPLTVIPDEDWYCDDCVNTDLNKLLTIQTNQLEKRKKGLNRVGVKEWGRGMACVGRTQVCETVPKGHFGPIPGIEVGMWWRFRFQASEAGLHTPLVAGIHGKENSGAYSIVFSCSYDEDIDLGNEFYYTASGGKDKTVNKCRVGGPQTKDQELKRCNKALALNCYAPFNGTTGANAGTDWQLGQPVRVLRSGNGRNAAKKSLYLPKVGVRYDGIYKVVKYWSQTGESGFLVWRYLLRRDDPTPSPWTNDGKNRCKRLGLTIIYPDGWSKETAAKRSYKMDEKAFPNKKHKLLSFSIPKNILNLIKCDKINKTLWQTVITHVKDGKQKFIETLELNFKCVCCLDVVREPVTTQCKHNICKSCLEQSFNSGVKRCPICRTDLKNLKRLCINQELNQI
ncbi:E3 ubiquitin-protein ligase UHRF1-like, partial [Oppia nitens]|uniref:E3 ubiquitin-protein ligase UHRF1-like n=1 Tax=Oppia nitens TaxID=1686743 RepID=UPI0023D9F4E0